MTVCSERHQLQQVEQEQQQARTRLQQLQRELNAKKVPSVTKASNDKLKELQAALADRAAALRELQAEEKLQVRARLTHTSPRVVSHARRGRAFPN